MPETVGIFSGRLSPCPGTPNCVRSVEGGDPPGFVLVDNTEASWESVADLVGEMTRTRIMTQTDTYLHAEATSFLFRFVDDLELLWDRDKGVVHYRSASRLGKGDMGVNAKRVASLRSRLEAQELRLAKGAWLLTMPRSEAPT